MFRALRLSVLIRPPRAAAIPCGCEKHFSVLYTDHVSVLQRPISTRPMLKRLLKVLFPSRDVYCEAKDQAQIQALAQILHTPGVDDDALVSAQLIPVSMLTSFTSLLSRVAARRPTHMSKLLNAWPQLLQRLASSFWRVHKHNQFHCAAQLETIAESLVNILHSYSVHLVNTELAAFENVASRVGVGGSKEDAVIDDALGQCLELLIQGLQHEQTRIRSVFAERIAALAVVGSEPATEVQFDDGRCVNVDVCDFLVAICVMCSQL